MAILNFRNNPSMHLYFQKRRIPYENKGTHLEVEESLMPQTEKLSWKRLMVIPDEKRKRAKPGPVPYKLMKRKSSQPYEPKEIIRMPVKEQAPLQRPPAVYSNRQWHELYQ